MSDDDEKHNQTFEKVGPIFQHTSRLISKDLTTSNG